MPSGGSALASNPARAQALGRAGRQRAQTTFSLQAMVSAYQGVYERQLSRLCAMQPIQQAQ